MNATHENAMDRFLNMHIDDDGQTNVRCGECRRKMFYSVEGGREILSCPYCGEERTVADYLGVIT